MTFVLIRLLLQAVQECVSRGGSLGQLQRTVKDVARVALQHEYKGGFRAPEKLLSYVHVP